MSFYFASVPRGLGRVGLSIGCLLSGNLVGVDSLDVRDESKTATGDGTDDRLPLAVVAHRLARCAHAAAESGIGDNPPRPHVLDQIILGNYSVSIFDEDCEQGEYLRLDLLQRAIDAQLLSVGVNFARRESILHGVRSPR